MMFNLKCGCCGNYFKGEKDPQHDKGFGTCPSCAEDEEKHAEKLLNQTIEVLRCKMSPDHLIRFNNLDEVKQMDIALKAIVDGVVTWKIN